MTDLLKLGADPEMFVTDITGKVISAAGKLGCTKEDKLYYSDYRLQEDNVLVEFDIDPQTKYEEFDSNIVRAMSTCGKVVAKHAMFTTNIASHVYTREEIESFGEGAMTFGCDPDYNILTGQRNRKPRAKQGLRTAGGHIHFGWDHMPFALASGVTIDSYQQRVGAMCDYFLGLESLILDHDTQRRELYGKAGAVRLKSYGLEYRSLSNFWIFTPELRMWAYATAQKAFAIAISDARYSRASAIVSHEMVQEVIDSGNVAEAKRLVELLKRV